MNKQSKPIQILRHLLRDQRGAVAVIIVLLLPFIIGLSAIAVDISYAYSMKGLLQHTADSAALAGAAKLPDNSGCNVASSVCFEAKANAVKNMPTARYGSVLANNDVEVGNWNDVIKDFRSDQMPRNAVRVTTRLSTENLNPLSLFLSKFLNVNSINLSAQATATYGYGASATGSSIPTWDLIMVQDITGSLSAAELASMKAADQALLECFNRSASPTSKVGMVLFTGVATLYQSMVNVTAVDAYNSFKTKIDNIRSCGSAGMPVCSGTNQSAGMQEAYNEFCRNSDSVSSCLGTGPTDSKRGMLVISDGEPSSDRVTQCGTSPKTHNCTDQELKDMAKTQADNAYAKKIDVSTLFYGGNAASASWFSQLKRGNGVSMSTPVASEVPNLIQKVCSMMPRRLVW